MPRNLTLSFPYARCSLTQSNLLVGLIVFHAVVLMSPVVYYLGFSASVVIPGTLLLLLSVMSIHARKVPNWATLFVVGSLVTACIAGAYWGSWRAALLPAHFAAAVLTASIATNGELQKVVRIGSLLLLLFLIGGWIAVGLASSGIPPLGTTSGLHGRVLYLYFTTMTPTVIGDFIRPAGIYDEPGALSLVVCVFAFLRHMMGMDRRFTWVLLILGFVTFSLAHVIYVVFHLLAERRMLIAWTYLTPIAVAAVWALASWGVWETFDARLVARLSLSSDSEKLVAGDNRTTFFFSAANALAEGDAKELFFGIDVTCLEGSPLCAQEHPGLAFNPLSPLVHHGLLVSWPYYLFLAALSTGILRRTLWPLFAVGLLFMQRPNVASAGYAMLAALTLVVAIRWSLKERSAQIIEQGGKLGQPRIACAGHSVFGSKGYSTLQSI